MRPKDPVTFILSAKRIYSLTLILRTMQCKELGIDIFSLLPIIAPLTIGFLSQIIDSPIVFLSQMADGPTADRTISPIVVP